ncbi:MAG: SufE family protein [Nanoarchaeota archaeon]|nr:SufE family protein [Nanoarchaeota archaeon]
MNPNEYLKQEQELLTLVPTKREMLELLVEYGKQLGDFPKTEEKEENSVPGCVSNVYIIASIKANKIHFQARSDSLIVRGYLYIIIKALEGLTAEEIINIQPTIEEFLKVTKISESTLHSRANAFGNIYRVMKDKAITLTKNADTHRGE